MKEQFAFKNYEGAVSLDAAIIKGAKYRITILSDILVRLEYSETGTFEDRPTELISFRRFEVPKYLKKEDDNFLVITTSYFKLEYQKNKPFWGKKLAPEENLKISLNKTDKVWFFGAAEARNFKGSSISLDNQNGSAKYAKGLYSTDGFASVDDSESLIISKDGSLGKRSDQRIDTYVFLYRKDFGFCLRDYFRLTDKPALIPRYALGTWWNKNVAYKQKEIEDLIWNFKKNEIPLSVFLMGPDWHIAYPDTYSSFTFDYNLIDNPKLLIDYLHQNKIRLGLNIDPTGGISPDEIAYERFKKASGYTEEGIIPFNVFNKQMLNAYLDELIKPLNEIGVDFYWIDYNNLSDLYSLRALNYFHFLDYQKDNKKRGIILSRNGMIASHKYPVLYSGQTVVSWDNLNMLPEFNSTAANIGLSWWSHDIGGYKDGVEDPELYMRYVQLGTYSPILRFSSDASHYYKREPWLWDVKTYSVVKDYLKLRFKLIPYIYTEGYKYSKTGLPLIQPLYYRYPEIYDEPLYKNEYYFGSELFIAPITDKKDLLMNRTVKRIFLPNGVWYDFKTGKKYIGGKRYVSFFKDEDYPVFAKRGTIIPLAILDDKDPNNTSSPKDMEIQVFPGESNIYKMYEDDGVSSLYKKGYYLITDIDYNYQANNFTVLIRPTDGKSGIVPDKRNYKIRFRNTRKPNDVILYFGEDKQSNIISYVDINDFVVEVKEAPTDKQISINCKGNDIEIDAERIINEDIDSIISDLQIRTNLKENIAAILFSDLDIKKKRIEIRKLRVKGLNNKYIRMFIRLLEYIAEL
jgi:alpha-glucosidase (family GH31 glycosyl hydrolase)